MVAHNDSRSQAPRTPRRFIDDDGRPIAHAGSSAANQDALIAGYRAMVRARTFDEKAVSLQRTGRLGTFASCLGQEATGVGVAQMMASDDVLLPSFREHAAQFVRGVTITELLLYWGGDERGSDFSGPREDFPVCIPVASHFPHTVGVAMAMKLRRQERVAVAVAGTGVAVGCAGTGVLARRVGVCVGAGVAVGCAVGVGVAVGEPSMIVIGT